MNNDSPPRSTRPAAGGEFTWPPTSEELEAIQVIPLDDTSAPRANLLPAPLEASAVTVAAPAIKRRRRRLRPPRRDDLLYLGVTFASTLAIAVAATSQLSDWDWRNLLSQHIAHITRGDEPPTPRQAASSPATPPVADTSSAADLAVLRLLAAPPDVAEAALAATPAPLAAIAKEASPAAPLKKIRDARVRRAPRMAQRTAQRVAPRVTDRHRLATRASTAAIPVSTAAYVRPRLISPEDHGRRGKLVLWVEVKKNGKVGDVDVLSSDLDRSQRSQRDLQRAAISNVKKWRYTPAMRDGEPTDTRVRVVVDIDLDSSRVFRTTTSADARRMGAAADRVADSVRAAR